MKYDVYADLSRPLTEHERNAVAEALDAWVPDSGCVGRTNWPHDEVYSCVEASSAQDARAKADHYLSIVLQTAGLEVEYEVSLQFRR